MHRYIFIARYMLFHRVLPGRASKAPIWNIWCKGRLQLYWTYVCSSTKMGLRFCVWDCGLALVCFSLSSFSWWTGLVTLEGEFCGPSSNISEGDIKCIFPLFHNEEQVVIWSYFSQKAVKIKYLGWSYHILSDSDQTLAFLQFVLSAWEINVNYVVSCKKTTIMNQVMFN